MGKKLKANQTKILVVCQHFWPESFRINDIVEYLLEKNIEVDVLCGRPNYPSGKLSEGYTLFNRRKENFKGATIYRSFEVPRGNNSNKRIFLNYVSFPLSSIFHIPQLLFKKYDRILLYQLSPVMMTVAGIIIGKLRRTETVMYVLDLWPENLFSVLNIKNKAMRALVTKISHWHYKKADKLVALSQAMKQRLLEITGKSNDDIIVLPQAAETLYETHIEDGDLIDRFKDTFNVVFTGNISPAQSFSTMINAAEIIKNKGISDIRWVIVGDGMSRKGVEKEIKRRNLSDVFVFEGHKPVSDMPKYTNVADVLVGCLVKSELLEATIPAKVMSYIASAKPIVLAMDGEVQELIEDKINCGYVGPTEDAAAFANNIMRVYNLSTKERSKLSLNAQKYHFKYLERNIILGKLIEFIKKPQLKKV